MGEDYYRNNESEMNGLPDYEKLHPHWRNYRFSSASIVTLTYWFVCAVVSGLVIFSWSFVVEVSTLSPGIIRPNAEASTIRSPSNGRIKQSFVRENQSVQIGDTLYTLETEALMIRQKYLLNKLSETQQIIADLKLLSSPTDAKVLYSENFRQIWTTFLQKMSVSETRLKKAQSDYKRNLKLHRQNVIADLELETYKFELDRAQNEVALTRKSHESQWQNELMNYERELRSIEAQLDEVDREIRSMVVLSPITGNVQRLEGIYPGSIVYLNQDVALISPDDDLIVEAYVSPGHIGLLHTGMKVRFLIDAFNYNQWGFGEGTVLTISNNIHLINDAPVFKIRCSLNRNFIQLKNGYKGMLRKGMSLKARFIVTERTLWQLLYDNMDSWLNPGK